MKISTFLVCNLAVLVGGLFFGPTAFDIVRLLVASLWVGGLGYITVRSFVITYKEEKARKGRS